MVLLLLKSLSPVCWVVFWEMGWGKAIELCSLLNFVQNGSSWKMERMYLMMHTMIQHRTFILRLVHPGTYSCWCIQQNLDGPKPDSAWSVDSTTSLVPPPSPTLFMIVWSPAPRRPEHRLHDHSSQEWSWSRCSGRRGSGGPHICMRLAGSSCSMRGRTRQSGRHLPGVSRRVERAQRGISTSLARSCSIGSSRGAFRGSSMC